MEYLLRHMFSEIFAKNLRVVGGEKLQTIMLCAKLFITWSGKALMVGTVIANDTVY